MGKVAVKDSVLSWALSRSGLAPNDVETRFPKIGEWVSGRDSPTLRQLEQFAKATLTPFGYFFLAEPPQEQLPIPYYRTVRDKSVKYASAELIEAIRNMQRRQAWIKDFFSEEGHLEISFVGSESKSKRPTEIANNIRSVLGFQENWASKYSSWENALTALRDAMELVGIFVVKNGVLGNNTHRKLNPDEFRGFVLVDEYAPFVYVNGSDYKSAQMFTLAHELAHIFVGESAAFDLVATLAAEDPLEQLCNQIAAEFLVPENRFKEIWPSVKDGSDPFEAMARKFKVSRIVVARRALDLGIINKQKFFSFYSDYVAYEEKIKTKKEERDDEAGGDFYKTQNSRVGKRFALTIDRAAKEGKLLYSEAYRLTGLYGKTYENYLKEIKGVRT